MDWIDFKPSRGIFVGLVSAVKNKHFLIHSLRFSSSSGTGSSSSPSYSFTFTSSGSNGSSNGISDESQEVEKTAGEGLTRPKSRIGRRLPMRQPIQISQLDVVCNAQPHCLVQLSQFISVLCVFITVTLAALLYLMLMFFDCKFSLSSVDVLFLFLLCLIAFLSSPVINRKIYLNFVI